LRPGFGKHGLKLPVVVDPPERFQAAGAHQNKAIVGLERLTGRGAKSLCGQDFLVALGGAAAGHAHD
jgi:hypothetical protein